MPKSIFLSNSWGNGSRAGGPPNSVPLPRAVVEAEIEKYVRRAVPDGYVGDGPQVFRVLEGEFFIYPDGTYQFINKHTGEWGPRVPLDPAEREALENDDFGLNRRGRMSGPMLGQPVSCTTDGWTFDYETNANGRCQIMNVRPGSGPKPSAPCVPPECSPGGGVPQRLSNQDSGTVPISPKAAFGRGTFMGGPRLGGDLVSCRRDASTVVDYDTNYAGSGKCQAVNVRSQTGSSFPPCPPPGCGTGAAAPPPPPAAPTQPPPGPTQPTVVQPPPPYSGPSLPTSPFPTAGLPTEIPLPPSGLPTGGPLPTTPFPGAGSPYGTPAPIPTGTPTTMKPYPSFAPPTAPPVEAGPTPGGLVPSGEGAEETFDGAKKACPFIPGSASGLSGSQRLIVDEWPTPSQSVAIKLGERYGAADQETETSLTWNGKGCWKRTVVNRDGPVHYWPSAHQDFLDQSVMYRIDPDQVRPLVLFDRSLTADLAAGMLTASSDMEEMNFLSINLANSVATGELTPDEARVLYEDISLKFLQSGIRHPWTEGFQFEFPSGYTGDPDTPAF